MLLVKNLIAVNSFLCSIIALHSLSQKFLFVTIKTTEQVIAIAVLLYVI